jgi:putative ABC transport system substrate-binding protein
MSICLRRREFIAALGGAAASWPLAARAQQPGRVPRVGMLIGNLENEPEAQRSVATVVQELEKLGWTIGRNLQIEVRWGATLADRAKAGAAELLTLAPDAILVSTGLGMAALQQATSTIPIVFMGISEPVARGFVASLARPGGNTTGFSNSEPTLGGKWLQLLKEIAPDIRRVAVIINPDTVPYNVAFARSAEAAAPTLNVEVEQAPVHELADIEAVMTRLAGTPGGGLIFTPDTYLHRQLIAEMAVRYRLPAVAGGRAFAEIGLLLSYGGDVPSMYRQAAGYVDRILRGEKPAELPVQQPVKFEFVINMKTAKALGIDIPPTLLALADVVIE